MSAGGGAKLAQEEWDFSGCPDERLYYCWGYEFARELPGVVDDYRAAVAELHRTKPRGYGWQRFDKEANWHYEIQLYGADGQVEDITSLELPVGFPDIPYLKCDHVIYKAKHTFKWPGRVRDARGVNRRASEQLVELSVDWSATDKRLVADFREWLKGHRTEKPFSRRGRSATREYEADLRALGAYRLLKMMSAPKAREYVSRFKRCLYSKLPDWYEGKARALRVLRNAFRAI